jgi:hypothetical protein
MRNIDKLKSFLKETADKIRATRSQLKEAQRKRDVGAWRFQGRLASLKYEYRHHHIAYCELRGRTRDQIEPRIREHNEPNERYIQEIKDKYAWSEEEIAAYQERQERRKENAA